MRTRVLIAGAALVFAAGVTACERSTPGTVAMTTEPGASTARSSTPSTSSPRTSSPRTSSPRTSSNVPPPSNSLTMTCEEYNDLDSDTQTAVIEEIVAQEGSVIGPQNTEIAKTLADAMCQFMPTSTVNELLLGGSPP
jgi:hypothetical protein